MCPTETEAHRRERRVRGFLDVVTEIATEAATKVAKAELANLHAIMQPGAIVRVTDPHQPPAPFLPVPMPPGRHLSVDACNRLKAVRLLLSANDPKGAKAILDDVMGW